MRFAGLGLLVLVAFATTGCVGGTDPPTPPAVAPASAGGATGAPTPLAPKDALLTAIKPLSTTTFRAKLTYPTSVVLESTIDPSTRTGTQTFTGGNAKSGFVADQLNVGGEVFLKYAFRGDPSAPKLPAGWMAVDLTKINQRDKLALTVPDPARLEEIVPKVGPVSRSRTTFTGTVDLRDIGRLTLVNNQTALGDKTAAMAVPFQATVDDQGRIASFTITTLSSGARPGQTWSVTYSGWGAPLSLAKPTAIPAPRALYALYNLGG